MSGIYNVNKISINGNVINGVDVTNLGISPQHVPSSFAVKREIAKITEDIDKKIQEELEIYRIPELKKKGKDDPDVPFTDVPNYPGVSIRLIAKNSGDDDAPKDDIKKMIDAGIPKDDLKKNKSYITELKGNKVIRACLVKGTDHTYEKKDVISYIDDTTDHRGWEVKIDCAKYKKFSDTYKVPRKIFLKDIEMTMFKVIKITFQDDETSFADKIHLKSIYAPDVITFGSTLTTALTESHVNQPEANTDAKLHSRIDITTRLFEGQFYPVSNQDIVLHNQSYCDFTNVVAISSISGTTPTTGYIKNVICPDTFRSVISNVHKGIKHITMPLNDLSVGYKTNIDFGTQEEPLTVDVYGFTPLFVDDHVKTTPQCVVEIPSGCKLSYRIEHMHKFESGEDTGKITSNCIKTECFECNYFDAKWPDDTKKIVYPVDRFRMISENEYFMKEFMGLKNTLIFDCLEKKKSESYDTLGHVNVTLNESKSLFTYTAYNEKFELTKPTIYLSNMLRTDENYYYLEKKQPAFNKFYPEFEHLMRQDADAVFCIDRIITEGTSTHDAPPDFSYYPDNMVAKVMLSNYKYTPTSDTDVAGYYAVYGVNNGANNSLVYTRKPGTSVDDFIREFEPLDSEQHQFVCPKLNYTSELSEVFDYTQIDETGELQKTNDHLLLTTTALTGTKTIKDVTFILKRINDIVKDDCIAYKNNGNWALTAAVDETKNVEAVLKNVGLVNNQYVYVRSKLEGSNITYTSDNTLFYVNNADSDPDSDIKLQFDNMIISEKINNQVVYIQAAKSEDPFIYYPDIRSFNHVVKSGDDVKISLVINNDVLQLINQIFVSNTNPIVKFENLYLTPNALRGVMEYVRPLVVDSSTNPAHKFDLSLYANNVYLPKGYASNAQVVDLLTLPTTHEYDPAILM